MANSALAMRSTVTALTCAACLAAAQAPSEAEALRAFLDQVAKAHTPPVDGLGLELIVTTRMTWTPESSGGAAREIPVEPLAGTLLQHPDGRTIICGWAVGAPVAERRALGTAFGPRGAVTRLADHTMAASREGDIDWRFRGLGLLDQSGRFLECESERCNWWASLVAATDVRRTETGWVLAGPSWSTELFGSIPNDGTVRRVRMTTLDRDGREAVSGILEVQSTAMLGGQFVPAAVTLNSKTRVHQPEAGYEIGEANKEFKLVERRALSGGEFDEAWAAFHRLDPGQLFFNSQMGIVIRGGARAFRAANQSFLAAEPFTSALLPPIEELLKRATRVE